MFAKFFSGSLFVSASTAKHSINIQLNDINRELLTVSSETEAEFLTTGKHLVDFFTVCQKNTSQAEAVTEMIDLGTGLNIDAFSSTFENAYQKAESSIQTVNQVLTAIESYIESLNTITGLQDILNKLSRSIRFLGTNMRVETARTDHHEFNVVTNAVESLVTQIKLSSKSISNTINVVEEKLQTTADQLGDSIFEFGDFVTQKHHKLNLLLNELRESTEKTRDRSKRIHQLAKQMVPEMGNINSALQFHDITRQQIEHVCEVIQDVIEHVNSTQSSSKKHRQHIYHWAYEAIILQIAQLEDVINNTDQSAKDIHSHFATISELIDHQVTVADKILLDKEAFNQRIQSVYYEMDNLNQVLISGKDLLSDLSFSVDEINVEFQKISDEVIQIESIREDLDDITLNAVIKASKTGKEGKVLEVLSEKIRILSDSAKKEISENDFKLSTIVENSAKFQNELSVNLSQQIELTETIRKTSIQSINQLIKEDESVMSTMNQVSTVTKQVKRDISRIIESITFDHFTRRKVGVSIDSMNMLLGLLTNKIPKNFSPSPMEGMPELNDLVARYTMQSERTVHEKVTGISATSTDIQDDDLWMDSNVEENTEFIESNVESSIDDDDNIDLW